MKTFKIWETGSTNAYYEAEEGDIIETLGAKEQKEQYRVDKVFVSDRGKDEFGITKGHIIKKDGTIGKKSIKITNAFDPDYGETTINTTVHTKN